jgi:hypothetical protein
MIGWKAMLSLTELACGVVVLLSTLDSLTLVPNDFAKAMASKTLTKS